MPVGAPHPSPSARAPAASRCRDPPRAPLPPHPVPGAAPGQGPGYARSPSAPTGAPIARCPPAPGPRRPAPCGIAAAVAGALLGGCVHTYQPLAGLHDPVVVDPAQPNLPGLRVDAWCLPGEGLPAPQAELLCDRVAALLEAQGATVRAMAADPRAQGALDGFGADETGPPALVIELHPGPTTAQEHPLSWVLFASTFTLVPAVRASTFSQELIVRDGDGFLLGRRTLRGRLVHSYGAGVWAGNKLLDWTLRPPEEELTGDAAARDLSADLYGQLSQLVFDATQRRALGGIGTPPPPVAP